MILDRRASDTRIEHDLLGDREVPPPPTGACTRCAPSRTSRSAARPIATAPDLIDALAAIKQAAALANRDLGLLDADRAAAIVAACEEIRGGALHDQFVVDLIQGGAGTSTNMNANEVIANRALELLGHARGDYAQLHPNEHVNMGQSTNDVYPTALKIAAWFGIRRLTAAMAVLRGAFAAKAEEFADVLKMGRTQLQDAVPMTLGQEFGTYALMLAEDEARLGEAASLICEINMGATAIGTGITAHPEYAARVCAHLREITGIPLVTAQDLVEATQDCGAFVQLSGVLKRVAVKLSKTCNDLRLLSSGPRAGFNEINLPARQAGSSIMPGKVNPVIPEVVNQVAFEVIGNDVTITMAAEAGQLQLNAFEPVIFYSLGRSLVAPGGRLPDARGELRARHHREPRAAARERRELDRHRHRAQPLHRLRQRDRGRARGAPFRPRRRRARAREGADDPREARRRAAARAADPAAAARLSHDFNDKPKEETT